MEEIIRVHDQHYILATSSRVDEHSRVLKQADTFAVFDRFGNIHRLGLGEQGVYHRGTRYLSRWEFRIRGRRPLLLSSGVSSDNILLTSDLTNPDISSNHEVELKRDQLHFARTCILWQGVYYERLKLRSFAMEPVTIAFDLGFDADFVDIFEVRGTTRPKRGEDLEPVVSADSVELRYRGLDEVTRTAELRFSPPPADVSAARCEYHVKLPPHGETEFFFTVACGGGNHAPQPLPFHEAYSLAREAMQEIEAGEVRTVTSNTQFNSWCDRSSADVRLMTTRMSEGLYPYAGVPWYSTVFGRDAILTAIEYLWINPLLARGVLVFLAAHQAQQKNPARDAEPGKIVHEMRSGEMASLGEIPFDCYYGTVDATPLFVMLAGAYYRRTADLNLVQQLWPSIEAALRWIDTFGDCDGDGFVEYQCQSKDGLSSQGWKDSNDSIFHADGSLAEGSIALCEVQGYVYAARLAAAEIATALGKAQRADGLKVQAEQLRTRFNESFWCEELNTYAVALDGKKRPCCVRTSNPGHCLFCRIVPPDRAVRVADTLLEDSSFSGWGIRTVANTEVRYNPMSYHNGSVWPHDNALAAAGLAEYRLTGHLLRLFDGLFAAATFVEGFRMPELFCGFARSPNHGPTLYPVACAPQSWAAASVFLVLQSLLGLHIDAPNREVQFVQAVLPESLERVSIYGLQVADASLDLVLERHPLNVGIQVLRREGNLQVFASK